MCSVWPLLSTENENSLLLFNPHQSGVKGGTAFPCSLPLIIAFFKQVRINFCHPKHHRVLLQHRSLLIHHQLLPVSLHWAETGWIVWISVLEAFIPGVLTPIKPFQEEMRTGPTLPCNKSLHLALAGCHFLWLHTIEILFSTSFWMIQTVFMESVTISFCSFCKSRRNAQHNLIQKLPIIQMVIQKDGAVTVESSESGSEMKACTPLIPGLNF